MSREADFAALMEADSELADLLAGGIYQAGALGPEGISRQATPAAFEAGYLLPCALVKERALAPDDFVDDEGTLSTRQVVEVYLYEDSGYTTLDQATDQLIDLVHGHHFDNTFPAQWINLISRARDEGALAGRSLARVDFLVMSIRS